MKIKFSMREKLYATIAFEIESDKFETLEEFEEDLNDTLDQIGEDVNSEDMLSNLENVYGIKNVKSEGLNEVYNIYPADECEFWDWEDIDE